MKRLTQITSLLLIIFVTVFMWMSSGKQTPELQDVSKYSNTVEKQIAPAVQEVQIEKKIPKSTQPAENAIALTSKPNPELSTPSPIEPTTGLKSNNAETEEEGIKIVTISVYESETDIIPLPAPKASYNLTEIKGFHILGNWNEVPLNLIVSCNNTDGCKKIHYLDWDVKHPNEFKLYEPLGQKAIVRVYQNEIQVGQFALASSLKEEFVSLNLDLDANTEFAYVK